MTTPIDSLGPATAGISTGASLRALGADAALTRRQEDFASTISRAARQHEGTPAEQARATAQEFVSLALVQPLLKQFRDTNHAAPPFAPSQGERQFQAMTDANVARQVVRASHFPLVDRLARDLLSHSQRQASASNASAATASSKAAK